jgi:hypothetical protein
MRRLALWNRCQIRQFQGCAVIEKLEKLLVSIYSLLGIA